MTNSKEIRNHLLQMHSQIETIRVQDLIKTNFALNNLRKSLFQIRGKELDHLREKLDNFACNLSIVKKKEFSFMKVFGLEDNELVHSCFLAWLLDPLESHNLGSLFVKEFLEKIGLKMNSLDFSNLHVEREISSDKSRLDIRIYDSCGKFQTVIENKIWSREGIDQTARLFSDFHDKSYEKELFIFLTLDPKSKPKDKNFISINYEQVLEILNKLLEMAQGDTRFLIKHYSNTLERLIMTEKIEGFSERTQLYYQYYKDTAEVKKAFENDRKLLLNTLELAIQESDWWDDNSWDMEKRGGDIWIWKNSWLLKKNEGIKIQLYMYITELGFAIRIYGVPSEFAAKFRLIFKKLVDKKYPDEIHGGLRKSFGTGFSRFLEKEIRFSPTEKTQIKKILENLNEIIKLFDATIIQSINELKQNHPK